MRTILRALCLNLLLTLASGSALASPASAPTASPAKPGTIAVTPAGITYFAQVGDTLISIAHRFTTRRDNWVILGKLNRVDKDISIPIGAGIVIPAELLSDEPSEAKVVALSGSIIAKTADGAAAALGLGSKVVEGMEIDTGSNCFLTIALPDASRISLPSNSRVKLAKLRMTRYTKSPRTEVLLLRGRVESRVAPLETSKGKFEVRTPQSVAGVRGTHFRVGIVGNGVVNEVLSGSVAVGTAKNPDAVTLSRGKGNLIDEQSVGAPVDLLPAPQIVAPGAQTVYAAAQFALRPVAGARAYHVQISTDSDGQNIVAESRSPEAKVQVDGMKDGDYFMHVSAIDPAGLQGWTRTQAFTLHARAEPPSQAPYVERSNDKQITMRWAAQTGQKFTLQVARDAAFTWLVFTANTDQPEVTVPRPAFGTYYARVQAINSDGGTGPFSRVQSFIVTDQWVINDGNPVKVKEAPSSAAR